MRIIRDYFMNNNSACWNCNVTQNVSVYLISKYLDLESNFEIHSEEYERQLRENLEVYLEDNLINLSLF
jgi:hypothetical protein